MKRVYTCFMTDVIHEGHMNIINQAKKYGEVIIGILTDEAIVRFGRFPLISIEERIKLFEEIDGISQIVVQDTITYDKIIAQLRPDYVVHGDDWLSGPTRAIRDNVEKCLKKCCGGGR